MLAHGGLPAALPARPDAPAPGSPGCSQGGDLAAGAILPGILTLQAATALFSLCHELTAATLPAPRTYSAARGLEQPENPGAGARERGLILGNQGLTDKN